MPKVGAWDISSIMTLYSTTLLVVGPRHMPPELTSFLFGEKMTDVVEVMFWVCRLAPST